jgi:hypothetical protein
MEYIVNRNAQSNGDHEVHKAGCSWMPNLENRKSLGDCADCHEAVRKAKQYDPKADGCKHCSSACHTR